MGLFCSLGKLERRADRTIAEGQIHQRCDKDASKGEKPPRYSRWPALHRELRTALASISPCQQKKGSDGRKRHASITQCSIQSGSGSPRIDGLIIEGLHACHPDFQQVRHWPDRHLMIELPHPGPFHLPSHLRFLPALFLLLLLLLLGQCVPAARLFAFANLFIRCPVKTVYSANRILNISNVSATRVPEARSALRDHFIKVAIATSQTPTPAGVSGSAEASIPKGTMTKCSVRLDGATYKPRANR